MRGRKPLPNELKILRGSRAAKRNTPSPDAIVPRCPAELEGAARDEWQRIAKELGTLGLLTKLDRQVLAVYCTEWARWVDAEQHVKTEGAVIETLTKHKIPNPWLSVAREAARQMKACAAELGLTPSARTRIGVKPVKQLNALDKFLSKRDYGGGVPKVDRVAQRDRGTA